MTRKEYFEQSEAKKNHKDIESVYLDCYNMAINNNDTENAKWFGDHILGAINQRWINRYVRPTGMLKS